MSSQCNEREVTFVPVCSVTGRVKVEDVISALRPNTCLVSIMLANNETGFLMPVGELSRCLDSISRERHAQGLTKVLLHTDAAQALGKVEVDVQELGVNYLTIVGHKFYGPRIGALYVKGLGNLSPLLPMFRGGGQERNFRPGTENTPMIAGLGKVRLHNIPITKKPTNVQGDDVDSISDFNADDPLDLTDAAELVSLNFTAYEDHMRSIRDYLEQRLMAVFKDRIRINSQFSGPERLPNTCNVSLLKPAVLGRDWLSHCQYLQASVGAACHSDREDSPSPVLLNSGVPWDAARSAVRLSVGRETSKEDIDLIVRDLEQSAELLSRKPSCPAWN